MHETIISLMVHLKCASLIEDGKIQKVGWNITNALRHERSKVLWRKERYDDISVW